MIVDFIFDVASPNTYFAHKLIPDFEKRTGVKFDYIPCLLGGIHKMTNNNHLSLHMLIVKTKVIIRCMKLKDL